jgi:hypothetical protein
MSYRTAKLLPVVLIGVLAGITLTLVPSRPAQAEECLTAPKASTPAGGHWRYRVERGTKRHCWYLAEKGVSPAPRAAAEPSSAAPQRSLADARAELITEPTPTGPAPESVWPAPEKSAAPVDAAPTTAAPNAAAAPGWPLASRWADTGTTAESETTATVADTSADTATAPVVIADTAGRSPFGSQAMLIAGFAAALGVAGLLVRLIIGFGGSRPIIRREQGLHTRRIFDVQIPDMPPPPWVASPPANPRVAEPAIDHEAEPPPLNWVRVARARSQADHASDAIEELLAKVSPRGNLGARHQG